MPLQAPAPTAAVQQAVSSQRLVYQHQLTPVMPQARLAQKRNLMPMLRGPPCAPQPPAASCWLRCWQQRASGPTELATLRRCWHWRAMLPPGAAMTDWQRPRSSESLSLHALHAHAQSRMRRAVRYCAVLGMRPSLRQSQEQIYCSTRRFEALRWSLPWGSECCPAYQGD